MSSEGAFPVFLEMGLGVDLVGEDPTKAARRAAREAMGRTSLPGVRGLIPSGDRADMRVEVTVAVPGHERVDVAEALPDLGAVQGGDVVAAAHDARPYRAAAAARPTSRPRRPRRRR